MKCKKKGRIPLKRGHLCSILKNIIIYFVKNSKKLKIIKPSKKIYWVCQHYEEFLRILLNMVGVKKK